MSGIDFDSRISYEPYHIYYDINVFNNDTTGTRRPPYLQFSEVRNTPYLANPSDYFASVVRFSVETPTLPVIIPQPAVNGASVNELIYVVSMNHPFLPAPVSIPVQYVPQSNSALKTPPTSITSVEDVINEYYYTFTYKPFIDMINTALRTCFSTVRALFAAGGSPLNATYDDDSFPYLWWDEEKNIATWVAPAQLFQTPTANNQNPDLTLGGLPVIGGVITPISIFFNTPLFNLFSSFSAFQNGYEGVSPLNWRMLLPDTVTINPYQASVFTNNPSAGASSMPTFPTKPAAAFIPTQPNVRSLLRVSQEYPTTPLWNPVQSIVFTTSLLPIAPSIVSTPVLFGAGTAFSTAGNNSGIANILTDLEVPLEKGWENKPSINYVPTAEYRLFDLNGNAPLNAIEISVNWKDNFGRLNPIRLGSGCSASIKIMFRRKDFQGVV